MTTEQPLAQRIESKPLTTADLAGNMTESHDQQTNGHEQRSAPLFAQEETEHFRSTWNQIQTGFVDEPRNAVEKADELVARCIKRLAEVFAEERTKMEKEWDRGDNVSTEDLRQALRRYRSFFDRLLSV